MTSKNQREDGETMWAAVAAERHRLASELESLPESAWSGPTVCSEWTVKQVGSHLILPFMVSKPRFALRMIRNRRDLG